MKNLIIAFILIAFGFMLGAGVGFKILEGFSTQLVAEAFDNSYVEFKGAYSGSAAQKSVQANVTNKIEEQKQILIQQIQSGFQAYAINKIQNLFK